MWRLRKYVEHFVVTIGRDVDAEYAEVHDVEDGSVKHADIPFSLVGIEEVADELKIYHILKYANSKIWLIEAV